MYLPQEFSGLLFASVFICSEAQDYWAFPAKGGKQRLLILRPFREVVPKAALGDTSVPHVPLPGMVCPRSGRVR
jgi:hypothetical protein